MSKSEPEGQATQGAHSVGKPNAPDANAQAYKVYKPEKVREAKPKLASQTGLKPDKNSDPKYSGVGLEGDCDK